MDQQLVSQDKADLIEKVIVGGDLSKLSAAERVAYYMGICDTIGLNWRTRPFDYLILNNKLVLYARKEATDQIRANRRVSVEIVSRQKIEDVYVVTARATTPDGRTDESTGAVSVAGLKGEFLANAYMKAETKSKRRVTLSICGLGWLDETEVDSIPNAKPVVVTGEGEIIEPESSKEAEAFTAQQEAARLAIEEHEKLLERIRADAKKAMVSDSRLDEFAKKYGCPDFEHATGQVLDKIQSRLADQLAAKEGK